jgi:hypothetical protein
VEPIPRRVGNVGEPQHTGAALSKHRGVSSTMWFNRCLHLWLSMPLPQGRVQC